jgi:hypothetical protein
MTVRPFSIQNKVPRETVIYNSAMSDPAPSPQAGPRNSKPQPPGPQPKTADAMNCDRCGGEMFRMHAVWRCPRCGFKTDCCGW